MCYPPAAAVPSIIGYDLEIRIRRFAALAMTVNHAVAAVVGGGGEEERRVKKQCLCSPTHHPGSFRCRHHHSEYIWAARPAQ
ncbi:hypothetical protein HanRHA438_Chr09g0427571 [Helianthus annuus]|uniref:Uncharacterized protein n=1 Tax=Helianthus annuus TaxID=4232 RepID=A0A9K3IAD2_HELAN|nr:hypothetical protein HanXRQr2_Chr09g0415411 [Helianthus annuus]KAJ0890774.1 hypothetical protein HanRHA438_Chr09g0427571 [Helianthus annuus]